MAWESTMKHGTAKGEPVGDDPTGPAVHRVAVGSYGGDPGKRTRKEGHDAFIHRLESHGHSPEQARAVAHRCGRKADDRS